MIQLKNTLNLILPITDESWEEILPYLSIKKFKAKESILLPGNTCENLYFIKKGTLKMFYQNDELVQSNLILSCEGEFIADYESFITQTSSSLNIQCIEETELIIFNYEDLQSLYNISFYWNKFGRFVSESIFLEAKRRLEDFLIHTPEERYLYLIKSKPHYFQKYPLKEIASYLNITPQSLSRIRKRLTKH